MVSPEMRRAIREEIRAYINVIGHAVATPGDDAETQQLSQNYNGGPQMGARPVVHPYGFVSRAPDGMLAVTGRVAEHPGAQMTLGHRDPARRSLLVEAGEAGVYSLNLGGVFARKDKVQVGSLSAANPMVLGTELLELMAEILNGLIAGDLFLTTSAGNPTAPNPAKTAALTQLKTKYLDTASTNIVSGYTYTQREAP